jgi:hypothetical protein
MGFFRQTSQTLWYVNQMDKIAKEGGDHVAWLDAHLAKRLADARARNPDAKLNEGLRKNIVFDYARRVANREKKTKAQQTHATCQICERRIQANTGVIAHHGYTRPGHGWQTQSCFGARYRAYEDSNDAMQPYIDMVTRWRTNLEEGLKGYIEDPPENLTLTVKLKPYETVEVRRPEGFDPKKTEAAHNYDVTDKYEREWRSRVYNNRSGIERATREIERMKERLKAWKPKT